MEVISVIKRNKENMIKKIFLVSKKYLAIYKYIIFIYLFLCIVVASLNLLIPQLTGNFFDSILYEKDMNSIYVFLLDLFILNIVMLLFEYASNMIYSLVSIKMVNDFIYDIIKHLHHSIYSELSYIDPNYLSHRINNDCNTIIIFCLSFFQNFMLEFKSTVFTHAFIS